VLGELAVLNAEDVGSDPGRRAAVTREAAMRDDVIAFGNNQLVLVAQRLRQRSDEVEQPRTAWRDVGAVLNVPIGPEPFGGGVVALVEQRVEGFEDERLVVLGGGFGHFGSP